MKHGNYAPSVKAQYEVYPYPPRDPAQEKSHLYIPILDALDVLNHFGFSGRKDFSCDFKVLVVGGGTGDSVIALAEQLRDTTATVYYLDLSDAAMAIAKQRAETRGLKNITWLQESLLELPRLGLGEFDYINCNGVLHHLESPEEGLLALETVLAEDGVLGLMLYATYGRAAVYQVQSLMRVINTGVDQVSEKISNTLKVIEALPEHHAFKQSINIYEPEIQCGPSGIYDLLLHSQDRAYTIPELYEFMAQAGMNVVRLFNKLSYEPSTYIKDPELLRVVQALPAQSRYAVGELLDGKLCKHTLYAAKHHKPPPDIEDIGEMIPALAFIYGDRSYEEFYRLCEESKERIVFKMPFGEHLTITIAKTPHLALIMKHVDGRRTFKEIFDLVKTSLPDAPPSDRQLLDEFRPFFDAMQASHSMVIRHCSIPPFSTRDQLQQRVSDRYHG